MRDGLVLFFVQRENKFYEVVRTCEGSLWDEEGVKCTLQSSHLSNFYSFALHNHLDCDFFVTILSNSMSLYDSYLILLLENFAGC